MLQVKVPIIFFGTPVFSARRDRRVHVLWQTTLAYLGSRTEAHLESHGDSVPLLFGFQELQKVFPKTLRTLLSSHGLLNT
jgi:hypothetical protein